MKRKKPRGPGWTVILVPPKPGARTREVSVSNRSLITVGATALLVMVAAATYTGETSTLASATADRLAESQQTVVGLLDSVQYLGALAARAAKLPPKDMIMPVAEARITSGFNSSRLHPILDIFRAHKGVDLAAERGSPIVASAAGEVVSVGYNLGYGKVIQIQHAGGVLTLYAHLEKALVNVGDKVVQDQKIALVGSSGLATGPHLHFEVIDHGNSVDPIKFLAQSRDPVAQNRALYGNPPPARNAAGAGGGNDGGSPDSNHR